MDRYIPNHIPSGERWWNVGLSLLILGWGAYGLWADDLIVPTKRGNGIHLHGTAAVIMFSAMMASVLNLLAVVADHFDIRNNELAYRRFAVGLRCLGGCFLLQQYLSMCFAEQLIKALAMAVRSHMPVERIVCGARSPLR